MRYIVVLSVLLLVVAAYGAELNSIEDLDIDALLKDDGRRKAAFACLLDQAPCGEFQKVRDDIPKMVETKCGQCTPKQKEKFEQINKLLLEKYPEQYKDLVAKYSPQSN